MTKKMKVKSYKCGDRIFFRDFFEVAYSTDYGCGGGNADWRTTEKVINQIKNGELGGHSIARIPKECTDWLVTDYDGSETVYCVVKGNIYMWQEFIPLNGYFVACGESAKKTSI